MTTKSSAHWEKFLFSIHKYYKKFIFSHSLKIIFIKFLKKLQQSSQSEWDFLALWSFLTIKPGNNAITAMPQSLMTTLKVNSSSRDVNCDKIQPVWQHMKLYGIRPKKAKNKKQTNKGKKRIQK